MKQIKELEVWVQLYDFEDYRLSNLGRILSVQRKISIGIRNGKEYFRQIPERIKSLRTNNIEPYYFCSIYPRDKENNRENISIYIHKAVADHFVEKPAHVLEYEKNGGKIYASHIVKDYENNRFDNVHFITHLELIRSQPNRLKDPTKHWRTRREKYGNSWGSLNEPKWNPNPKKRLETIRKNKNE